MGFDSIGGNNLRKAEQLLFVLRNADMWTTNDQPFRKVFTGTKFIVWRVFFAQVSGAFNSSAQGGIYSAPNKGGSALIATTTNYGAMNQPANNFQQAGIITSIFWTVPTFYLSLSSANNGPFNCDVFIYGYCID
jgi:hypothetical protein